MAQTKAKGGEKLPIGERAATLDDIAARVGVSKVAVSVVLNNARSQVRVSQATRERIIEAAQALNYHPNALARSLQRQSTNIIGFYSAQGKMFDPLYPFFGAVLKGLLTGCEDHQKDFLVHGTFAKRSEETIFLELLNGQIDGLVLYAREVTPLIQRLIDSRLPVVTIADEVPGLPCVTVDGYAGGQIMARYLADKGYKSVLYRVTNTVLPSTIEARWQGFQSEARARGLKVELYHATDARPDGDECELLLSAHQRPQVVAAFSDYSADRVIDFCAENGVRVPDDLAVVGFDGFASTLRPSRCLTTVRAPWDEVARAAVSLLVAQCNGQEVAHKTMLPVELSVGDTA